MSGIIKIVKSGEELVEDGATGEKFFAKYAGEARKVGTEANKIAEAIVQAKGFDSVENFLMTANKDLLDKLDELVDIEKGYKFVLHTGNMIFVREDLFPKLNVSYNHELENFRTKWGAF